METMIMNGLDWIVVGLFFVMILVVGMLSGKDINSSADFFVGGGKIPWWLSGVSHHVSGYSAVVFVGYAGIAYAQGTSIYFWWALNIALATFLASVTIIPRWPRLRKALGVESPTEYLMMRYNRAAQLLIAVSGIVSKLLDVAAKWTSIGILLHSFAGVPIWVGVIISGLVSLIYIAIGGIMADLWTDFIQFMVQVAAGLALFIGVIAHLGDYGLNFFSVFSALPAENLSVFNAGRGQGSVSWTLLYFFVIFFSYSGGTWNLAARFIATTDAKEAKTAGMFSAALYLVWPFVLFFPMWCGPLLFPGMDQTTAENTLYSTLTSTFLPHGMIGLVLASMFANTMTMCNSDANTISAVLCRDILPIFWPQMLEADDKTSLKNARIVTIIFTGCTVVIGIFSDYFGGVTGLILTWFSALLGPTAIPLLLGLFPAFKYCDGKAAVASTLAGLGVFVLTKLGFTMAADVALIAPLAVSFVVFYGIGLYNKHVAKMVVKPEIEDLMVKLSKD